MMMHALPLRILFPYRRHLGLLFILLAAVPLSQAQTPGPLNRLTDAYLSGAWDEVETMFTGSSGELQSIAADDQSKVSYMRQSLAECRPAWWKRCKAGESFAFTPKVWNRTLPVTFAPAAQATVQYQVTRSQFSLALTWPAADMDSAAPGEHGFSKGDLRNCSIWATLGTADAWSAIPLPERTHLKADENARLQSYLDFRSSVTCLYYGTPNTRRYTLCLCLVMHESKRATDPVRAARQAVAAMFMSEVVANPERYPSVQLPKELPAENTEARLALELRPWVEKHAWTLVEDKLVRDASAALAAANGKPAHTKGQITLANGMVIDLDPEQDKVLRPQRDQWFKSKLDAAAQTP